MTEKEKEVRTMHYRILVIKPVDTDLEKIMYNFEEIDKDLGGRMADERCRFIKQISENEIPAFLTAIRDKFQNDKKEYLKLIQYRANHTQEEYKEKYGRPFGEHTMHLYKRCIDGLNEYETIKYFPSDDVRQIKFIKEHGFWVKLNNHDVNPETYIKGIGYGYFDNPYAIFDYYRVATEEWYKHLTTEAGKDTNTCLLTDLDVTATLDKLCEDDYYPYIIFCKDTPADASLFTVEGWGFSETRGNAECLVDDTGETLKQVKSHFGDDSKYEVKVLDIHS